MPGPAPDTASALVPTPSSAPLRPVTSLSASGHVVVCGLHDEGLRVVEQLVGAGVGVVVVDDQPDPRLTRSLDGLGVTLLAADPRLPETLDLAGVDRAAALVCVEVDDLHTLATALLARQRHPDVRVVVQLRNAAVGRALQDIGVRVLDVASLTAPSVVEACLRTGRWTLGVEGHELEVVEAVCLRDGTLRDVYGDLVPVALVPADGRPVEVTPGRDLAVAAGDTVVLLGTPDDLTRAHLVAGSASSGRASPSATGREADVFVGARAPRHARVNSGPGLVRHVIAGIEHRARLAVGALAVLAGLSVTILYVGYSEPNGRGMSLLDALYFTVETIGTVGYGDFSFREQAWPLRVWAIVLMVVGATLATVFFALLTNALIGRRIEETLGRRRLTGLVDHVVVVGAGSIGVAVARRLKELAVPVVVLERDPDNRFLPELRAAGIPVATADATAPDVYDDLRLDRARAVAVLTSDDLVNIESGLAVRDLLGERWADVPVVLRIFDRALASTVEGSFSFRNVRSPAALAAPWFVGAALGLDVVGTFYVGPHPLLVARLRVEAGDALDGVAMRHLGARLRVVSIASADGEVLASPRRDTSFAAGDTAVVIGPYEEILSLLRRETRTP